MNTSESSGLALQTPDTWATLATFAREEAQRLIQSLLEAEAAEKLARQHEGAPPGPGRGCRSGHGRPRRLRTLAGDLRIRRPRLRGLETAFRSDVLPSFIRRFREAGATQIAQYLAAVASGDFDGALFGLLGGPSPLPVEATEALRSAWKTEHETWRCCSLRDLKPAYIWIDRLEARHPSGSDLVVAMAALEDGDFRVLELRLSGAWSASAILARLRERGLRSARLVVGGGNLTLPQAGSSRISPTRASR